MRSRNDDAPDNFQANQNKWMVELEKFLEVFADSDEVAQALFHLANANEFNGKTVKAWKTIWDGS